MRLELVAFCKAQRGEESARRRKWKMHGLATMTLAETTAEPTQEPTSVKVCKPKNELLEGIRAWHVRISLEQCVDDGASKSAPNGHR
jgi:hypothetical protein